MLFWDYNGYGVYFIGNPKRSFMQTKHIIRPCFGTSQQIFCLQRIYADHKTFLLQSLYDRFHVWKVCAG